MGLADRDYMRRPAVPTRDKAASGGLFRGRWVKIRFQLWLLWQRIVRGKH